MDCESLIGEGKHRFRGAVPCRTSGLYGCRLRIRPRSRDEMDLWEPGLLFWDS